LLPCSLRLSCPCPPLFRSLLRSLLAFLCSSVTMLHVDSQIPLVTSSTYWRRSRPLSTVPGACLYLHPPWCPFTTGCITTLDLSRDRKSTRLTYSPLSILYA